MREVLGSIPSSSIFPIFYHLFLLLAAVVFLCLARFTITKEFLMLISVGASVCTMMGRHVDGASPHGKSRSPFASPQQVRNSDTSEHIDFTVCLVCNIHYL